MANKEYFNKATAEMISAGKGINFRNAAKKCDLAAMLVKHGIDSTIFDNGNDFE